MDIDEKIVKLENIHTYRPQIRYTVALTMRLWLAGHMAAHRKAESGGSYAHDARHYLTKSYQTVHAQRRVHTSDVKLYWLSVFIAIETGRLDQANEMLDTAMEYKSFFKTGLSDNHNILYFLYAYLEIKQKRVKSANKYIRSMAEGTGSDKTYNLLNGILRLMLYEYEEAFVYLSTCYDAGMRSVFLFWAMFEYYRAAVTKSQRSSSDEARLMLPVANWALARHVDVDGILQIYQSSLRFSFLSHTVIGGILYDRCRNPQILREICADLISADDCGAKAFEYYKEAENQQLIMPGLYQSYMTAACVSGYEKIRHYTMMEYLRDASADQDLVLFVYHVLLTNPTLADLAEAQRDNILQYGFWCLENGVRGRMVNSLYFYMWEHYQKKGVIDEISETLEHCLAEGLTRYELQERDDSRQTHYIYVTEPERKGVAVYALAGDAASPGTTVISAASDQFSYHCIGKGHRHILDTQLSVKPMIARENILLYRYFFKKGVRGFALLVYLSNYYLKKLSEDERDTDIKEAILVFEATLQEKNVSRPYRMRVNAVLGNLYCQTGRFDEALTAYDSVDENCLDSTYMEQMLSAFMETHLWSKAAGLIMRKAHCVSERSLFNAVCVLSEPSHEQLHPQLVETAYRLLIGNWFNTRLLNIVLTHYIGSQSDWQALSRALAVLDITEKRIDRIILRNSIFTHQFDENVQRVFIRAASNAESGDETVPDFIYFCIYEMIINNAKPLYETINLLERRFLKSADDEAVDSANPLPSSFLLGGALSHVYLYHDITTFNSENILLKTIAMQERAQILFPIFKKRRDKLKPFPYIEMNQPFLYRSLPQKNVWLYHKIGEDGVYNAKPMTYLRFGLYMANLAHFYGEKLIYYFSEELPSGNITTKEKEIVNNTVYRYECEESLFFTINNAIINERMFKHDEVEQAIGSLVKEVKRVNGKLL